MTPCTSSPLARTGWSWVRPALSASSPNARSQQKARTAHTYVVGITGQGKSKLLQHMLFQDITRGRGCGLLDPHSDLASDVLRYLASWHDRSYMDQPYLSDQENLSRIVYFDPSRTDYIPPFNVLKTPFGVFETAQNIVEAFRRTWPESLAEAPQFSNIALAALITLIENKLSLVDMHRLLTDQDFREGLLDHVSNSEVVAFFHDRYDRWGREAPLMRESTLNKVAAFTFNPQLRLILGSTDNALDFPTHHGRGESPDRRPRPLRSGEPAAVGQPDRHRPGTGGVVAERHRPGGGAAPVSLLHRRVSGLLRQCRVRQDLRPDPVRVPQVRPASDPGPPDAEPTRSSA